MRIQLFGLSFALAVAGCGGDGDGGKVMVMPDAKVFMDAPPVTTPPCVTPASIPALGIGMMNMPANGPFIAKTMNGQVFFGLAFFMDQAKKTAMTIIVVKPGTVANPMPFQTNTPYANNPDPNATMPAALAFIEDGLDAMGNNPVHTLWASSGATTFTAIGQMANNPINGSMNATNFREIDGMTGADIAGGCTASAAGVQFYLTQMTTVTKPAPTTDGLELLPPEHVQRIVDRLAL